MSNTRCIRCGSIAELLLNLVCCSSPRCKNFDKNFYRGWLPLCKKIYSVPEKGWKYLGTYSNSYKFPDSPPIYDLYTHGPETYVVFGSEKQNIYVGSSDGEPYGVHQIWWFNPTDVDKAGVDALLEAAARRAI